MEPSQAQRIIQNLPELIEKTACNASFLAIFQQQKLLSREEIEILEAEMRNKGSISQSKKFYDLIITRNDSYSVLEEALEKTCQTGALNLLRNETSEPKQKAQKRASYVKPPKYLAEFLNGLGTTLVIHTPDSHITRNRFLDTVPNVVEYTPRSFASFISNSEATLLASQQNLPLINCMESISYTIANSFKNPKKKIVLVEDQHKEELPATFESINYKEVQFEDDVLEWDDLHVDMQIKVEDTMTSFQLIDEFPDILSKLKGRVLFDLINGRQPVLFKNTIPPSIKYYIPRRLITRNVNKTEVLQSGGRDLFLIKGIERHQLTSLVNGEATDTSRNLLANFGNVRPKYVVLEDDVDYDKMVNRFGEERPVHAIEYNQQNFTWIKSSAGIYTIQGAVDSEQKTLNEDDFLESVIGSANSCKDPVCISDSPGMGKTILLAQMARKLQERATNFWNVGFVVISEFVESIKNLSKNIKPTKEQMITCLANIFSENELGIEYFCKHTSQLTDLLLDGLDELQGNDVMNGYELLTKLREMLPCTRIWVTTRPHMFANLEKTFNVLGYNIMGFEERDQLTFLELYWSRDGNEDKINSDALVLFSKTCLHSVKSQIKSTQEHDIAGIPLQCLLIGEVFEEDALKFATRNAPDAIDTSSNTVPDELNVRIFPIKSVTDLYKQMVKKKFSKFSKRYDKVEHGHGYSDLMKEHTYYSLWLLFPRFRNVYKKEFLSKPLSIQTVFNVGILESKTVLPSPRFLHRTFAEYFVAEFVVKTLSTCFFSQFYQLLYEDIFETKKPTMLDYEILSSEQFIHNVICYFIDSQIKQKGTAEFKNQLDKECWRVLPAEWKKLSEACAYHSFENIFDLLICDLPSFQKHEINVITEEFIVLCTVFSNARMVNKTYEKFRRLSSGKELTSIKYQGYSLIQYAARRGNYNIFEKNYWMVEKHVNVLSKQFYYDIIRECVSRSKAENHTIKEKLDMLRFILKKSVETEERLYHENYMKLFSTNMHIDLAVELLQHLDPNEVNIKDFLKWTFELYNCKDTQRLLQAAAIKYQISANEILTKYINKEHLLRLVFREEDSSSDFLQFLETAGFTFTLNNQNCCTIKYNCNHQSLKQLFSNFSETERKNVLFKLSTNGSAKDIHILILLMDFIQPNQIDDKGNTLLHHLCSNQKDRVRLLELTKHLMLKGADLKIRNEFGETALDCLQNNYADRNGLLVLEYMLTSLGDKKEDIFYSKIKWITKNCKELKFENYADICSRVTGVQPLDRFGNTLLHLVAGVNDYATLEHLLSLGTDVNAQNNMKETALHSLRIGSEDCFECWKALIDNSANVCALNTRNKSPLVNLITGKGYDSDKLYHFVVCAMSRQLQMKSSQFEEIFLTALSRCSLDLAEKLCEWFTKNVGKCFSEIIGGFKGEQATVLDAVLFNPDADVLEYVTKTHNCVNALQPFGNSWFFPHLDSFRAPRYLRLVCELFQDIINTPNEGGIYPLCFKRISAETFSALCELGANVNIIDKWGYTPLHWVLKNCRGDPVESQIDALINHGADVNAVNNNQETPLSLSFECTDFLRRIDLRPLRKLLQSGANIKQHLNLGNTALHLLPPNINTADFHKIVDVLLEEGYNDVFRLLNDNNQTPIQIAQQRFILEDRTVHLLQNHGMTIPGSTV